MILNVKKILVDKINGERNTIKKLHFLLCWEQFGLNSSDCGILLKTMNLIPKYDSAMRSVGKVNMKIQTNIAENKWVVYSIPEWSLSYVDP